MFLIHCYLLIFSKIESLYYFLWSCLKVMKNLATLNANLVEIAVSECYVNFDACFCISPKHIVFSFLFDQKEFPLLLHQVKVSHVWLQMRPGQICLSICFIQVSVRNADLWSKRRVVCFFSLQTDDKLKSEWKLRLHKGMKTLVLYLFAAAFLK